MIISDFTNYSDGHSTTKALLDHLLELVAKGFFEQHTQLGYNEVVNMFQPTADAVYNLEKHATEKALRWSILRFLEVVMRKSDKR